MLVLIESQSVIIYPFGESFPIKISSDYLYRLVHPKMSGYLQLVASFRNLGFSGVICRYTESVFALVKPVSVLPIRRQLFATSYPILYCGFSGQPVQITS